MRQLRRGSISLELLMFGGGMRNIFLLPLVDICLETIDVCIWHMFAFMSTVMTVWRSVGMFVMLLFAFQSMFISIWVSRLEITEFPDSVRRSDP